MTLETMQNTMANREYLGWRAFHTWRAARIELETKAAKADRRGR